MAAQFKILLMCVKGHVYSTFDTSEHWFQIFLIITRKKIC